MKEVSRRARRMDRHHKLAKGSPLNLVSLMDIFTILVFFLLVNSSNTQQLPSNKELTLPSSTTKKAPEETLVLMVTKTDILVQGRKIVPVETVAENGLDDIPELVKELTFLSGPEKVGPGGRRVTILGDENVSYDIVRKILSSCQQAEYTNIAFAATQVAKKVK